MDPIHHKLSQDDLKDILKNSHPLGGSLRDEKYRDAIQKKIFSSNLRECLNFFQAVKVLK